MEDTSLSTHRIRRVLVLSLMLALIFVAPAVYSPGYSLAAPGAPVPLVRIDLDGSGQAEALNELGLSVYLQLPQPDGSVIVLLPADEELQGELARRGYPIQVIEPDSRQGSYYLLKEEGDTTADLLDIDSTLLRAYDQVVIRLDPATALQMSAAGARLRPLPLVPLAAPQQPNRVALPDSTEANPLIQRMVNKVSQDTLHQYVGDLSGEWPVTVRDAPYQFFTRYTYEYQPITKATRFTYEHFDSLGILADYHYFSMYGLERRNVLAQQTGLAQPERIFLLIAHLDSISQSPATSAPGADDNASGSAAVMHIADILKDYPFGCSLRYVLFTGEEQGLHGSWAYAGQLANQGVDVVVVLNLDMIGYSPASGSPEIELHTRYSNETDLELAGLFADIVPAYQLNLDPVILNDSLSFSDHYPFWQNGFPGILAIEDWAHHTPYYHTTNDRLSSLNMGYYTEFTKAALATYAHIGCLQQGELAGTVRATPGGAPIAGAIVTVQSQDDDPWITSTQADGSYQLPLYAGDYTVTVSAPGYLEPDPSSPQIVHDTVTTLDLEMPALTTNIFLPLILASEP